MELLASIFEKRRRIEIIFKSGASLRLRFTKFEAKFDGPAVTHLTWAQNWLCGPRLGFVNLTDIDSIVFLDW